MKQLVIALSIFSAICTGLIVLPMYGPMVAFLLALVLLACVAVGVIL